MRRGMVESPPAGRDRWADVDMPQNLRYAYGIPLGVQGILKALS